MVTHFPLMDILWVQWKEGQKEVVLSGTFLVSGSFCAIQREFIWLEIGQIIERLVRASQEPKYMEVQGPYLWEIVLMLIVICLKGTLCFSQRSTCMLVNKATITKTLSPLHSMPPLLQGKPKHSSPLEKVGLKCITRLKVLAQPAPRCFPVDERLYQHYSLSCMEYWSQQSSHLRMAWKGDSDQGHSCRGGGSEILSFAGTWTSV